MDVLDGIISRIKASKEAKEQDAIEVMDYIRYNNTLLWVSIITGGVCAINEGPFTYRSRGIRRLVVITLNGVSGGCRVNLCRKFIVIMLDYALSKRMSAESLKVIFSHEIGHIVLNHSPKKRLIEQEIEADLYACRMHGKNAVVSTFRSLIQYLNNRELTEELDLRIDAILSA